MARFFMAGGNFAGGTVLITGADAEHAKVLRLKIGDRIIVCDGDKTDHHCTVTRITPEEVEAEVVESGGPKVPHCFPRVRSVMASAADALQKRGIEPVPARQPDSALQPVDIERRKRRASCVQSRRGGADACDPPRISHARR